MPFIMIYVNISKSCGYSILYDLIAPESPVDRSEVAVAKLLANLQLRPTQKQRNGH